MEPFHSSRRLLEKKHLKKRDAQILHLAIPALQVMDLGLMAVTRTLITMSYLMVGKVHRDQRANKMNRTKTKSTGLCQKMFEQQSIKLKLKIKARLSFITSSKIWSRPLSSTKASLIVSYQRITRHFYWERKRSLKKIWSKRKKKWKKKWKKLPNKLRRFKK